jgi:hypothetical protein
MSSCFEFCSTDLAGEYCKFPKCCNNLNKRRVDMKDKMYLGDGVYIGHDGYHIILANENSVDNLNVIHLEQAFIPIIQKYIESVLNRHETGFEVE